MIPDVRLRPKAAETMALAIHELATNSVKYGALSKTTGRVEAVWRIDPAERVPQLRFQWAEAGGPPIETTPDRRGFGTELLERTLAYELKAKTTLKFDRMGLRCTIVMPLTEQVLQSEEI